jgi:methyl-accepting chemotaxis protein WspA
MRSPSYFQRLGLAAKLIIPFVSVFVLAIAALGAIFLRTQSGALSQSLEKKAEILVRNLATALSDPFAMGEYDLMQQFLLAARQVDNDIAYAIVVGLDGMGNASTDPALRNQRLTRNAFEAKALELSDFTRRDTPTPQIFEVVMPVRFQSNQLGILRVGVSTRQVASKVRQAGWTVAGVGALALLVGVTIYTYVARRVVRPLRQAVGVLKEITAGHLDVETRMETTSQDEVGRLANGFNLMTNHLAGLIQQVQQSGIQVTTSATQLAALSKQLESMMTEQVAATREVVATATEIAATSQALVRTMHDVTVVSEDTATAAASGQTGLARMAATMQHMEESTRTITARLGVINTRVATITSVVTTITKVADQTNLLSLNAAIEAEKAGEYGRGFAIVAREIRRLADQTAVATLDIEHTVKEMTAAVSTGVLGMDQFAQEVRHSVEEVRTVGSQLTQIIDRVQALTPRFDAVNAGMQTQAQRAQQISEAMHQLSEAAQQTAASLHASAQAIGQLTDAAQGLHASISRFRVQA